MKFCGNCGNQLNEVSKFCPQCGESVEQIQPPVEQIQPPVEQIQPPVEQPVVSPPPVEAPVAKTPSKAMKPLLILGGVLVVILVIALLYSKGTVEDETVAEEPMEAEATAETKTETKTETAQEITVLTWQEQYDLGVEYLSEGNLEDAILALEVAVTLEPTTADTYLALAEVYVAMDDIETAVETLERGYALCEEEQLLEQQTVLSGLINSTWVDDGISAINNGGTVVEYNGEVYFWMFDDAILQMYDTNGTQETFYNRLVAENEAGDLREIFFYEETGSRQYAYGIYIVNGRLYSQMDGEIFSVMLDGSDVQILTIGSGNTSIVGMDDASNTLVLADNGQLYTYQIENGQLRGIVDSASFIALDNGIICYTDISTYDPYGAMEFYFMDLEGNDCGHVTTEAIYGYEGFGSSVEYSYVVDGYLYISYGRRDGTANIFQGGNIDRIHLATGTYEHLTQVSDEALYLYEEDGQVRMAYCDDMSGDTFIIVDVETMANLGSISATELATLVPTMESDVMKSVVQNPTTNYILVDYIEEVGDAVYYCILGYENDTDNPDYGWRGSFDLQEFYFCKQTTSSSMEVIYSYEE